jgi:hypothetical protein
MQRDPDKRDRCVSWRAHRFRRSTDIESKKGENKFRVY